MDKWEKLKVMLINNLEQAEAGELHEQEEFCVKTLELMDMLEGAK